MEPFEVWGSPEVARDVIYTEDFAGAAAALLNASDIKFDVFNVGSGEKTTVGDAVKLALKAAGHTPVKTEYKSSGPTTIKSRSLDISKIKKQLGWKPAYSAEQAIEETTKWWTENKGAWNK